MDLQYLEEFVLLAEVKNYTEVADQLNVSDSSLSRHIKALEAELGVPLFARTSRTVHLNAYGQIYLAYAKQIVNLQRRAAHDLHKAKERNDNTVLIGTNYYVDDLLVAFHHFDKSILVNPVGDTEGPGEILDMLRLGLCELALVVSLPETDRETLEVTDLGSDQYVVVLHRNHPLTHRSSLALSELAEEPFVSFRSGSYSDNRLKSLCREAGFEPNIISNANVGSAVASLVNMELGVSILFKNSIAKTGPEGMVYVDLEPPIVTRISLCHLRAAPLSRAAQRFKDFVCTAWRPEAGEGA